MNRNRTKKFSRCHLFVVALVAGLSLLACRARDGVIGETADKDPIASPKGIGGSGATGSAGGGDGGIGSGAGGDGTHKPVSDDGSGSSAIEKKIQGFDVRLRVKNLPQLRGAIEACLGLDLTLVTDDMLIPVDRQGAKVSAPSDAAASGRFAFLNATRYAVGADALLVEGMFLLDPNRGERFGADADQISAPYLRALETVANVVAHNCSLNIPLCDCSTDEKAAAMLARCLPAFDPKGAAFKSATTSFSAMCRGGEAGLKAAIASMLASYSFAAKN